METDYQHDNIVLIVYQKFFELTVGQWVLMFDHVYMYKLIIFPILSKNCNLHVNSLRAFFKTVYRLSLFWSRYLRVTLEGPMPMYSSFCSAHKEDDELLNQPLLSQDL